MKQQTYFRSSWLFILLLFGMFAWMLYTSGGRQNEPGLRLQFHQMPYNNSFFQVSPMIQNGSAMRRLSQENTLKTCFHKRFPA